MSIFDVDINFDDIKSQFPSMFEVDLDVELNKIVKEYYPISSFVRANPPLIMLQKKHDMGCHQGGGVKRYEKWPWSLSTRFSLPDYEERFLAEHILLQNLCCM